MIANLGQAPCLLGSTPFPRAFIFIAFSDPSWFLLIPFPFEEHLSLPLT
jgi:hypothetical protein